MTVQQIWDMVSSMIPNMIAGAVGYGLWAKLSAMWSATASKK